MQIKPPMFSFVLRNHIIALFFSALIDSAIYDGRIIKCLQPKVHHECVFNSIFTFLNENRVSHVSFHTAHCGKSSAQNFVCVSVDDIDDMNGNEVFMILNHFIICACLRPLHKTGGINVIY